MSNEKKTPEELNLYIRSLENMLDTLVRKGNQRNRAIQPQYVEKVENIRKELLIAKRLYHSMMRKPPHKKHLTSNRASISISARVTEKRDTLKVLNMVSTENEVSLKMAPAWFQMNNKKETVKGIVYPPNTIDTQPFDVVAHYRACTGQSTDFVQHPITFDVKSTETLFVILSQFVRNFDADLDFTNDSVPFDDSAYRVACGIGNLGNMHVLNNNFVPMAIYTFVLKIDYEKTFAKSTNAVETFCLNFCREVSQILSCNETYVRVSQMQKEEENSNETLIKFSISMPDEQETRKSAEILQNNAKHGFTTGTALIHVKPDSYNVKYGSVLSYFQLQISDFDRKYNMDYRKPGLPKREMRGKYPYHLPIGWYRHALNLDQKYPGDRSWIGHVNAEGEWPVAFHGTQASSIVGIIKEGLALSRVRRDAMRNAAVKSNGSNSNKPGLYVATYCNGGAHPQYTKAFSIETSTGKKEEYRVVFMCRVQPGKFSRHSAPVKKGEAWRFVDADAIRPYGLLLKKE